MSLVESTILHYTILEEIGRGGMGVVYKAHDSTLQRDVALKFVPDDQSDDARERFLREARAVSRLSHKNIVSIHAIERGERDFIVMEYVKGRSLRDSLDSLESKFLPLEQSLANAYGGRPERAHALLEEAEERVEGWGSALIQSWIAVAYAHSGRPDLAQAILDKMLTRRESEHVDGFALAYGYIAVGDGENALKWLETAVEEKSLDAVWLKVAGVTFFESIGADPRYQALVERMEFPE